MKTRTIILAASLTLICGFASQAAWAQHEFRSGHFVTSDGVELHYLEAGSGPALVFVPGWTVAAESWEGQLAHFAATHRVVALDPRSQGRSEKVTEGHHLSRRGQDIGELIEHLDAAPAVVVGFSLGVLELLTYADEFGTDALRAAVLVDMRIGVDAPLGEPHPSEPAWRTWISNLQLNRAEWTRALVRGMHRSEQTDEYFEALAEAMLATPTNTAVTLLSNLMLIEERDLRPALERLGRPVLYTVTSPELAADVQTRRPDARVEVFTDAGHFLFVDEPERFNRVLEEFLATLPEQ
jgi:non-heme chloroperoxidase